jgi:hypothetical protein
MAQAGFFPSIVIYFCLWYRKRDQTMRMAIVYGGAIISGVWGGILVCTSRSHKLYNVCY